MKEYYRICLRHMGKNDNCFLFWCNNSSGYTRSIEDAGLYEEKETSKNDPIVSKDIVDKFKKKVGYLSMERKKKLMQIEMSFMFCQIRVKLEKH